MYRQAVILLLTVSALMTIIWVAGVESHRSGCHRWHSCPSDRGTYTCGDLGYCSQCPDNQYCLAGQRRASGQSPTPEKNDIRPTFVEFTGKVVGISDGDTITVLHDGKAEKIRLHGIDCPEKGQPFGSKAKQFTSSIVFGKTVTIKEHGRDKYGRMIGDVVLTEGASLNRELVKAGLAWWYRKYAPDDHVLRDLEQEARAARRGLWADRQPIPPWAWRKGQRAGGRAP